MPTAATGFFWFWLLLVFSYAGTHHFVSALSRRILHQPFFPLDSTPPSPPPSPPQTPFSGSTPAPGSFFPTDPSPPPPPPPASASPTTPANFASFPANISSLAVPQSPKPSNASTKLVVAAVVAAVLFVTSAAAFFFCRRRRDGRISTHEKPFRSESIKLRATTAAAATTITSTGSDILYLGTMVNSRAVDGPPLDSPELRPLPPLNLGPRDYGNGDLGSERNDEEDEFYSPKGFGSGSARGFSVENFGDKSHGSTCSSSNSPSPTPSFSISLSPPISFSPRSSHKLHAPPSYSDHSTKSPTCSSPERDLDGDTEASPQMSTVESPPKISSAFLKPVSASPPPPPPRPPPPTPPPPPPPPPLPPKNVENPTIPAPPICRQVPLKPPALTTPSRPFVFQNPSKVSPVALVSSSQNEERTEETPKPKLKPLHWDKVRASSDREMVWDQLKSSSFKLDEEMIETLFVVNTSNSDTKETNRRVVLPSPNQENRVLDPKKSQNIAILLRALNVTTEEVCEALLEGNADALGTELLESLLKMAPTKEEERKLKEYNDDSPVKLGSAERFLKAVLDIPFAFKRVDAMLYITNFESEVEYLKKCFETLEAACEELRSSRMFLKLLEAVLKTGNRMNVGTNRGDAHAFKLDTLLKLVDVKGADGKTTLLHFVVQEIIRAEGARLSSTDNQTPKSTPNEDAKCRKIGLQVVSGLSSELNDVKKAAAMDSDVLSSDVSKLSRGIENIREVVRLNQAAGLVESSQKFCESMNSFMKMAEEEIIRIQALESVAVSLVKEITEYFHGNSAKEEAHPFRIFMVVRDFVTNLDRVCKEVGMINERTIVSTAHKFPVPVNPTLPTGFPGSNERHQYSSSEDESSSP